MEDKDFLNASQLSRNVVLTNIYRDKLQIGIRNNTINLYKTNDYSFNESHKRCVKVFASSGIKWLPSKVLYSPEVCPKS